MANKKPKKSTAESAENAKDFNAKGAEIAEVKEGAIDGLIDGQWRVGSWHGMEMHTCVHCQWDTLEGIWEARAHKAVCPKCMAPAAAARAVTERVMVADEWGNPIEPVKGG